MSEQTIAPSSTTTSIYPIAAAPEIEALLDMVLTSERDDRGRSVLRRTLTADEKTALSRRRDTLFRNLEPARYNAVKAVALTMLAAFPSTKATEEEGDAMGAVYATALKGLSRWSVERACSRFTQGTVAAEEVGARKIDRAFAPSSAQVRMVADKIERPYRMEATRIGAALLGVVERPRATGERRAALGEKFKALADALKGTQESTDDAERERARKRIIERERQAIIEDYRRRGLEPVITGGLLVSLSFLLGCGWTVQEIDGKRALVAPPPPPQPIPPLRQPQECT